MGDGKWRGVAVDEDAVLIVLIMVYADASLWSSGRFVNRPYRCSVTIIFNFPICK